MKKVAVYILAVMTFLTVFAGCKQNEVKTTPTPAVSTTPIISSTPAPATTSTPNVTETPKHTDEAKPDVDNGIVEDKDGIITEDDSAGGKKSA